jgi:hypothetical protein
MSDVTIEHCGRTVAGDVVGVDLHWDGPLAGRVVAWSMRVGSDDGSDELRLVHRRDGERVEQFVEGLRTGRRDDVEPDADIRDDEIVMRFPADVVGTAVEWPVWTAVITVDGEDVASRVVPLG